MTRLVWPRMTSDFSETLAPAFHGNERVFGVFEPYVVPEFVIGLRQKGDDGYEIFGATPALTKDGRRISENSEYGPLKLYDPDGRRIAKEEEDNQLADIPNYRGSVRLEYCQASIETELAEHIITAWDKVVLQTRFQSQLSGPLPDGDTEHFASRFQSKVLSGETWSPQPPGNPGWLSRASHAMIQICRNSHVNEAWGDLKTAVANIH